MFCIKFFKLREFPLYSTLFKSQLVDIYFKTILENSDDVTHVYY
jgi:hypothetical protein